MMLASFDVLFVTETWRGERQELFTTTHGHVLFLSGGEGCRGVGIVLSVGFFRELLQVSFHAYSPRICALHFQFGGRRDQVFPCYFPTTWDTDDAVDETYELLNLLYSMLACGMALFQSLLVILMLVLDHHASLVKLNI